MSAQGTLFDASRMTMPEAIDLVIESGDLDGANLQHAPARNDGGWAIYITDNARAKEVLGGWPPTISVRETFAELVAEAKRA